ncbi:hypothetical protein CV102_25130 [Natronococcus pandeyae]|uniref:Uncharacterized protein n=1 Tax=Natronococcus pandeyae TaxID=2055836 RepID=A0A8J8PWX4_9EURY|nr:hypothetical protein CV102_25130 [Natronococcus pandeyae]
MESDDTSLNGKHTEQYTTEHPAPQRPKDASQCADPPAVPDRYAALNLAQDETYIYDQGDPDAWIQSDTARSLEQIA